MATAADNSAASKSRPQPAAALAAACKLGAEARRLLEPNLTADALLAKLVENDLLEDAVRFTAHKLEKRRALWWATLCLWDLQRQRPAEQVEAMFQKLVQWFRQPDDVQRRRVEAASRTVGLNTPLGMLGQAVYFSDGSISLPDCPEVEPDPLATPKQIAAAVLLAARKTSAAGGPLNALRRYLVIAAAVEQGQAAWTREPNGKGG